MLLADVELACVEGRGAEDGEEEGEAVEHGVVKWRKSGFGFSRSCGDG
jgi:hypothetical protein